MSIPSIEQLRQRPGVALLERDHGAAATTAALRHAAADLRSAIAAEAGTVLPMEGAAAAAHIEARAAQRLAAQFRGSLRPVINATGVVIHTNLGRAPLRRRRWRVSSTSVSGYSNLEYDLAAGHARLAEVCMPNRC